MELKQATFGNPTKIVIDKVKVFAGSEFKKYCSKQGIEHLKLALEKQKKNDNWTEYIDKWYKFCQTCQGMMNPRGISIRQIIKNH